MTTVPVAYAQVLANQLGHDLFGFHKTPYNSFIDGSPNYRSPGDTAHVEVDSDYGGD